VTPTIVWVEGAEVGELDAPMPLNLAAAFFFSRDDLFA
jgi:hypothetical protein